MSPEPEPISPCVGVCVINQDTGMCYGCYRLIQEIGGWVMMTREQRREVLAACDARKAADPSRKQR
jgi:predicted Fe-S protein YdhL (DUF1289 family)